MRLTILKKATRFVAMLTILLSLAAGASGDLERIDVSSSKTIRSSLIEMSQGMSRCELHRLSSTIQTLIMPDLWNYQIPYDEGRTHVQVIAAITEGLERAGARRYWVHDRLVDELIRDVELLRMSAKFSQIIAIRREIAELRGNVAESRVMTVDKAKLLNADRQSWRERIQFLEGVATTIEATPMSADDIDAISGCDEKENNDA